MGKKFWYVIQTWEGAERRTKCKGWHILSLWFSSVPLGKCNGTTSSHDRFLSDPVDFTYHCTIQRYGLNVEILRQPTKESNKLEGDSEGNVRGLIRVTVLGGQKKTEKNFQTGWLISWPRFQSAPTPNTGYSLSQVARSYVSFQNRQVTDVVTGMSEAGKYRRTTEK
jgi:hypothetical protein